MLLVRFFVAPTGQVTEASARPDSDVTDEVMVACVVRAFHGLTFPPYDQARKAPAIVYALDFGR